MGVLVAANESKTSHASQRLVRVENHTGKAEGLNAIDPCTVLEFEEVRRNG